MEQSDDNEYFVPLQDQRVFGAGIKRKRINFVPPSDPESSGTSKAARPGAGDRYLSIVFGKDQGNSEALSAPATEVASAKTIESPDRSVQAVCEVCKLPLSSDEVGWRQSSTHETTIAHQVCVSHSDPPSHLDRNRPGLKYLSSYGWDPDSRTGLGVGGAGIRVPVKAKPKYDTLGIGSAPTSASAKVKKDVSKKLDAKQTREAEAKASRKRHRIQESFYQSEDVQKYLGPND
ncbi:MAG: hypothetical protein LQ350_000463 [Teloschistes chrysophthalmus]|nr:MAG: hypothetical protein LQ350_000463 [Niorma chrysophthalma]